MSEEEAELVAPVKPVKKKKAEKIMLNHIQDGCQRVTTTLAPPVSVLSSWLCSHVECVSTVLLRGSRVVNILFVYSTDQLSVSSSGNCISSRLASAVQRFSTRRPALYLLRSAGREPTLKNTAAVVKPEKSQ